MKFLLPCFFIFIQQFYLLGQRSEELIPEEANSVFTFNNVSLFKKIPLNTLVNYDFMEELQSEFFDGSTDDFSLEKLGINLNSKLNIFYGKSNDFIVSGSTFEIKNKELLFKAFDDYDYLKDYHSTTIYNSLLNNLIIYDDIGIILRAEPTDEYINYLCDSVWYSNGNSDPFYEILSTEYESLDEEIYDENSSNNFLFPEASEDPSVKNYFELRDSLTYSTMLLKFDEILENLVLNKNSFSKLNSEFSNLMEHEADGMLYINSNSLNNKQLNWLFSLFSDDLNSNLNDFFSENTLIGEFTLLKNDINLDLTIKYDKDLGQIYESMSSKKFDKNILKYIPENATGIINYNLNLKNTYEEIYKVIFPLLEKEQNNDIATNVILFDLIHEFFNKEKFFKTFNGNVFGYLNGIQKVPVKRVEFVYDEENFEYSEIQTTVLEDVPTFTIGMRGKKNKFTEKLLNKLVRLIPDLIKKDEVYIWKNKILNSLPLYIVPSKDAIFLSNDQEFLKVNNKGFKESRIKISKNDRITYNKLLYLKLDLNQTLDFFPLNILPSLSNEYIQPLKGKSGNMTMETISSNSDATELKICYSYTANDDNYSHFLNLVNALYIISKK